MAEIGHNNPPPDAGPYAIYRTAKIKTGGALAASAQHMCRSRETLNADQSRAHLNRVIIGSDDPEQDVRRLLPTLGQRDADGLLLRRSNSVLAVEILLTTSPEWWHTASDQQKAEWEIASIKWLQNTWGVENVCHVRIHGDETTPHLTGYVVPLDARGALNCRSFIGERQQLRDQQTGYAAAVERLGLQRGVSGSTATHEAVKRAYGQMSASEQPISVPAPPHLVMSPDAWATEASEQMLKDMAPTAARAKNAATNRTKAKASKAQATKDRSRADRAEVDRDAARAIANKMRSLDLSDVCDALGFTYDDKMWHGDGFKISLGTGAKAVKWYDHRAQTGSGGAIDLVRHTMQTDFKSATAWLADRFGTDAAAADITAQQQKRAVLQVKEAVAERKPFTPPEPIPQYWAGVRTHLINIRRLPFAYIDKLHDKGEIYADIRKNAVFICKDEHGVHVGAELKGTQMEGPRFTGLAAGSKKDRGGFRIGSIITAKAIYLVESAIDAISLLKLKLDAGDRHFAVISTAGVTPKPRTWLLDFASNAKKFCAFDADEAGDKDAHSLRRHSFERLRPTRGKDWNDQLIAVLADAETDTATNEPDPDTATNEPEPDPDTGPSL